MASANGSHSYVKFVRRLNGKEINSVLTSSSE